MSRRPDHPLRDVSPFLQKLYVHHYQGQVVLTTSFIPKEVGPSNIVARIGWRDSDGAGNPPDAEKLLGDNLAFAANMERGQL